MASLFQEPQKETREQPSLFAPALSKPRTQERANALAQETVVTSQEPLDYESVADQFLKEDTVGYAALDITRQQIAEGVIKDPRGLALLKDPEVSLKEKEKIYQRAIDSKMGNYDYTARQILTLRLAEQGKRDLPLEVVDSVLEDLTPTDVDALRRGLNDRVLKKLEVEKNRFVASRGWDNFAEGAIDVAVQELTPVLNVGTKLKLQDLIFDAIGIDPESKLLIGSRNRELREGFLALPEQERLEAFREFTELVKAWEEDPVKSVFLGEYNILERMESVFTDGVLEGEMDNDTADVFWGNFESIAEGVFSAAVLGRFGFKSVGKAFKAHDANKIAQAADATANRKLQQATITALQGEAAEKVGINAGEAALATLPRPATLADARGPVPRVVEETVARSDKIRSRILDSNLTKIGDLMSTEAKQAKGKRVLDTLNEGNSVRVMPAMSVVRPLDDDTGVAITGILGKTDAEGWSSLDDLLPDLVGIDPNLTKYKVMTKNDEGVLVDAGLTPESIARIVTNDPKNLSDADLVKKAANIKDKDSLEYRLLDREARSRVGPNPQPRDPFLDDEFFLQYDEVRPYHPMDVVAFEGGALNNTMLPNILKDPNAKFGDALISTFFKNYMGEQRQVRLFEQMYSPFYTLNREDKRMVSGIYEWGEDFAKNEGRAPDVFEVAAQFGDLTDKQWAGYTALRQGLDTQYEVFNQRLYTELKGRGGKTIQDRSGSGAPSYHGVPIALGEVRTGNKFYDPISKEMKKLDADELAGMYANGGGILKLDIAIDVPGQPNKQATLVMADGVDYKMGELHQNPLEYYPGYSYRFYEDPYYIIKETNGIEIDGVVKSGQVKEEAIKTAGSQLEAEQFLNRIENNDPNVTYKYVLSTDIDQGENLLRQKESLHREGRMFWDKREREKLPNVNGDNAETMDFVLALERGTAMAARQNSQEEAMKAMKNAFYSEYGDLSKGRNFDTKSVDQIVNDLRVSRNNATGGLRKRYDEAIEVAKYLRSLESTGSRTLSFMRSQGLRAAVFADRLLNDKGLKAGKFSKVEKWAGRADPMQAMRSTAFHAFMVFRPIRQALLQASQITFLTGLDPAYVLSGRATNDAFALRRGFIKNSKRGFDDDVSIKYLAARMGLSQKEYRKLLKEFERSGVIDIVDVHSFAGGQRQFHKRAAGKDGALRSVGRGVGVTKDALIDTAKRVGFDFGERLNKVQTYNVAWRRRMKAQGYKSLLEMKPKDWDAVQVDTERLALGMNSMNKAGYQVGAASVATQFLSFTHKVALTLMGQNPAIKGKDVVKLWAGMFTMFGANMFGARDYTRQALADMGFGDFDDRQEGNWQGPVADMLTAGLVQTIVNKVGNITSEDWAEIDTENFTPVLNILQFYELSIEGVIKNPATAVLGPFGSLASSFMSGLEFSRNLIVTSDEMAIEDKFLKTANMMLASSLPAYNDASMALVSAKMGQWYRRSGESIALRPTYNALVGRALLGARTVEENAYWDVQDDIFKSNTTVEDMIKANRKFLKQKFFLYGDGQLGTEELLEAGRIIGMLAEAAPDGRKLEVIEGSMLPYFNDDDPRKMPAAILATAMNNQTLEPEELHTYIDTFKDITPEDRLRLHRIVDDFMDDSQITQEQLRQKIVEQGMR